MSAPQEQLSESKRRCRFYGASQSDNTLTHPKSDPILIIDFNNKFSNSIIIGILHIVMKTKKN